MFKIITKRWQTLLPLLFLVLFITPQKYLNAGTFIFGDISDTLHLAGSPYIVTGNLTVNPFFTLTIDSGVVLRFRSNQGLYVHGNLNARHVLFTSDNDTTGGNPQSGDWYYIQVGDYYNRGTAKLDTCNLRYGGTRYPGYAYGNVVVYAGEATIAGCEISNSKNYGVMLGDGYRYAKVTLTNTSIFSCDWPIGYSSADTLISEGINTLNGNIHNGIVMGMYGNSNDLVLDTMKLPYFFPSDYTVANGGTLVISPPNIVKFGIRAHLYVGDYQGTGTLKAYAGLDERINFTAYTDDNIGGDLNGDATATIPASGYWGGIVFMDSSEDARSSMKHCSISFAGYGNTGGISMYNASPVIDSCDMANNYYGVLMQDVSSPLFSNNTIGSSEMVPIAMSYTASPVLVNNALSSSDNTYDAIGLLGSVTPSNGILPIRSVTSIPNITYLLLENVEVPAGKTFTINKGVVIKSCPDYNYPLQIIVRGKLIANGTPDSMIVITSVKDDNYGNPFDTNRDGTQTFPEKGDWGGFSLNQRAIQILS